jgi:alkylation response protein AidB-like acyl-CoA dehydrogenase
MSVPTPSDELAAFRAEARSWLEANIPAYSAPLDGPESRLFVLDWQRCMYEGGWAGLTWPSAYGGRSLSVAQQIVWFEEYARSGAPSTHNASFVGMNHAGPTIIACGSEEQKAFHLPKILSGEVIWCQGFSEPGSGSDLASLRTKGRIEGDEIVIDGQKIWSSYADIGDYQELLIRTDPESVRHKGLTWLICPMDLPGITVRPIKTMAGPAKFCEVFYDQVRVPIHESVVGGIGEGWKTAMATLSFERGTASLALQIGLVGKIEKLAADCADPFIAPRLADLRADAAALKAMSYAFALSSENGTPGSEGSLIRLYFAELAKRASDLAVDLYGIGSSELAGEHGWAYEYLDAYSETIAGGTAEIQRNIIGERVLGLPRGKA